MKKLIIFLLLMIVSNVFAGGGDGEVTGYGGGHAKRIMNTKSK